MVDVVKCFRRVQYKQAEVAAWEVKGILPLVHQLSQGVDCRASTVGPKLVFIDGVLDCLHTQGATKRFFP